MRKIRTRISCRRSARSRTWRTPEEANGLRIDAGYREGDAVSPHYDAMLAKVIAWAPTRDVAIERLNRGLEDTDVRGIVTNIPFLSALVTHPDVRANTIDTGFIERELKNLTPAPRAAARSRALRGRGGNPRRRSERPPRVEAHSPWRTSGWMPVGRRQRLFTFRHGHERRARDTPAIRQRSGDAVDRRARTWPLNLRRRMTAASTSRSTASNPMSSP